MPLLLAFRRPASLRGRAVIWLQGLRHWLGYRPERRYMRGRLHGTR